MSPENIAKKIQPIRRTLLVTGVITLLLVAAEHYFDMLIGVDAFLSASISFFALAVLVVVIGADIVVSTFHPQTGFLRSSSKWNLYFPWLRHVILLIVFFVLALPIVGIIIGVT